VGISIGKGEMEGKLLVGMGLWRGKKALEGENRLDPLLNTSEIAVLQAKSYL
jgi:hypothetical protein